MAFTYVVAVALSVAGGTASSISSTSPRSILSMPETPVPRYGWEDSPAEPSGTHLHRWENAVQQTCMLFAGPHGGGADRNLRWRAFGAR